GCSRCLTVYQSCRWCARRTSFLCRNRAPQKQRDSREVFFSPKWANFPGPAMNWCPHEGDALSSTVGSKVLASRRDAKHIEVVRRRILSTVQEPTVPFRALRQPKPPSRVRIANDANNNLANPQPTF